MNVMKEKETNTKIDKVKRNAILQYITQGNTEAALKLIEDCDLKTLNAMAKFEQKPMYVAVRENNVDVLQALIDKGVEVDITISSKYTFLIMACKKGYNDIAKLLVENIKGDIGLIQPTLIHACSAGLSKIVELLIQRGADVNYTNAGNSPSPLMYASSLSVAK